MAVRELYLYSHIIGNSSKLLFLGPFDKWEYCSQALMVIILDPFQRIKVDTDRSNNVLVYPFRRECTDDMKQEWWDTCSVYSDPGCLGMK